jgi:two-component sensor histidine kinase
MALYELGTNAVKHGALANETGRIVIRWRVDPMPEGDVFSIGWKECHGPPVKAPLRTGFGRTVMERMTSAALGGKAALAFDRGGIAWTLVCPARRVLEAASP